MQAEKFVIRVSRTAATCGCRSSCSCSQQESCTLALARSFLPQAPPAACRGKLRWQQEQFVELTMINKGYKKKKGLWEDFDL